MPNSTKSRTISRQIASEIMSGKYRQSGRLPSEAQFVIRFRVSRPTIVRALRELQDEGLIDRRKGSGTYVRPEQGRPLESHSLSRLGLIVPSLCHTEIFETLCGELASLARVNDFTLLGGANAFALGETKMTVQQAEELCCRFVESNVGGVFFVPFENQSDSEAANQRIAEHLRQAGIPMVLLDRDLGAFPYRSECDIIGVDNYAGGYLLGEHLAKLGAKRLAYVMRPFTAPTVKSRIAGARMAMLDYGLEAPQRFARIGEPTDLKFVRSLVQSQQLDAILCTSDHVAAQLLQSLTRLGVRVPKDIRVVGFDDMRFANLLTVPLTTVEQPYRDIATTAFNALRERIKNASMPPRILMLTPRIVVRETCGAYSKQSQPIIFSEIIPSPKT